MKAKLALLLPFYAFIGTFLAIAGESQPLSALVDAEDRRDTGAAIFKVSAEAGSAKIRARAALAIGRIQKPELAPLLVQLLQDEDRDVVRTALWSAGQLGWQSAFGRGREASLLTEAVRLSHHSDVEIRVNAVQAIGKLGLANTADLVFPLLRDRDEKVRAEALIALFRHRLVLQLRGETPPSPPISDGLARTVLGMSTDPSSLVRESLAYFLARVKLPTLLDVKPVVLALSRSKRVWTRLYATMAMKRLADPALAPELARMAGDRSHSVRIAALEALTQLSAIDALDVRTAALVSHDRDVGVRSAYAGYLASGGPTAVAELTRLGRDPRPSVRGAALRSLAKIQKDATAELLSRTLSTDLWPVRIAAVEASSHLSLIRSGNVPSVRETFLLKASRDSDLHVRAAALEGMASIESPESLAAILAALKADELSVRGTAVGMLSQRNESGVLTAAWSCYLASPGEKWVEIREGVVGYLGELLSDETTGYLRQAMNDRAVSVAIAAREALVKRGVAGLPELPMPELTFSPYRELRFARNPVLELKTNRGTIRIELFAKAAQIHVATIVGFAEAGKYDGLLWHRVISNFVIQGGDPDGSGWGGAGYSLRAELHPGFHYGRGTLGMPRSAGFDTGGVQLFISHVPTPHLDDQYTIFGRVVQGLDVVDNIEMGDSIFKARVIR